MSIVLYGNPNDGFNGRTWGDAVVDIAEGINQCANVINDTLSPYGDYVTSMSINGNRYSLVAGVDLALNNPDSFGIVSSAGVLTKDGMFVQVSFTPSELIETLYVTSHNDTREPSACFADWLYSVFSDQFDDTYH